MNYIFCLLVVIASTQYGFSQHDSSAILDIESTDKGVLIPRLTTEQKNEIQGPATGLLVYDINLNAFSYFDGTSWMPIAQTRVVDTMDELYHLQHVFNNKLVLVKGFRDKNDGGGGLFIFEQSLSIDPFFNESSYFPVGYSEHYDGMVVKSAHHSSGRWIRQWDRGSLNLRWFGGAPGNRADCSKAFNAALKYAQFELAGWGSSEPVTIFNNRVYTRPGKTIYIPSGRYYFHSPINDIHYGVVIEGEGNMGTSAHGTRLLLLRSRTQADVDSTAVPNDEFAFFRYLADGTNSSGGGMKNLSIALLNNYDANVISLIAPSSSSEGNPLPQGQFDPAVSKWTAENITIAMGAKARRAMYMRSDQVGGSLPWRIRDISLINCWFAGANIEGETVRAMNTSGLHVVGGLFASGLGVGNQGISPGIFLGGSEGCANTHLNGVDLTHGDIKITEKSRFINVDCRYRRLLLYDGPGREHVDLQVTKTHILNPRTDTTSLVCPVNFTCYKNSHDIESDPGWQ